MQIKILAHLITFCCFAFAAIACNETAEVDIPVTGVNINPSSLNINEGETFLLDVILTPSNTTEKTVEWTSSDPSVAAVDTKGNVTAVKAGETTVTATAGGKSAVCSVTVAKKSIEVTGVTLNSYYIELTAGSSYTLTTTIYPSDATDKSVSWTSSDPSVASVDTEGNVTALVAGTSNITAKSGSKKAICLVKVSYDMSVTDNPEGFENEDTDW